MSVFNQVVLAQPSAETVISLSMGVEEGARRSAAESVDHGAILDEARFALMRDRPTHCSHRRLSGLQIVVLMLVIAATALAVQFAPYLLMFAAQSGAYFGFSLTIGFRIVAAAASLAPAMPSSRRWTSPLPTYTLLCPLFLEADVAPQLVAALKRLDYPTDKLDIKLILEEDDVETRAAIEAMKLGAPFEIVVVPDAAPRTKPKALNYALAFARGEFVAVYDAEDVPHPDQLKAALDAFAAGEKLACVQAPLLIDNAHASWIASQFAAEYAIQFRILLPLLARLNLPLPLGGTSNHFRIEALKHCGGWDPFNVTEDADLGYRLARDGWRIGMISSPTWEEAPISFNAWLKQRARWIKGHMQTWLVLMRQPFTAAREMGLTSFVFVQLILLGGIVAAFAHGPLALIVAASLFTPLDLLGDVDAAFALCGYATAIYGALAAAALLRDARLAMAALTMPLYWPLATIAALRALVELAIRPHHWDKTEHGLSERRLKFAARETP